MWQRKQVGLTLIELMVTIAILAIVITVGYPMYERQVLKAHRTEARGGLVQLSLAQQKYNASFARYATGANHDEAVRMLNFGPDMAEDGADDFYYYDRALADVDAADFAFVISSDGDANTDDFMITVTAIGSQEKDKDCRTFTIDQTGIKMAKDADGVETDKCW